jgi:hypothetical protein
MTSQEINDEITNFLDSYFEEEDFIIDEELNFLEENSFVEVPSEINYIKLRRFIETAYHNLKNMDPTIEESLVGKLYHDFSNLLVIYVEFLKKTKIVAVVYVRDFLENVPTYVALDESKHEHESTIARMKGVAKNSASTMESMLADGVDEYSKEFKHHRRRNVDAIHEMGVAKEHLIEINKEMNELRDQMQFEFEAEFKLAKDEIKEGFEEIINTKIYYFDNLFWYQASRSPIVRAFFDRAKIEGEFSTKTYLQYYLKSIDIDKTGKGDWHRYLHSVLKVLD